MLAAPAAAQEISATGVERGTPTANHAWRLIYENDFFAATDRFYTQGIYVEYLSSTLRRSVLRRLLYTPTTQAVSVGVAFGDEGYTGRDLKRADIVAGDHPWAGTKQLSVFAVAADTVRHRRVSSQLTVGLIGQGAAGREIQTFIHKQTGNTVPQGWGNQIRNDLILNYALGLEQRVFAPTPSIALWTGAQARAGTYQTSLSVRGTLMIGRADRLFVYANPTARAVGYDATLQGGMFNRSSPYTIEAEQMRRLVYGERYGVVYRGARLSLEFFRARTSAEFAGGSSHSTGGISVGVVREPRQRVKTKPSSTRVASPSSSPDIAWVRTVSRGPMPRRTPALTMPPIPVRPTPNRVCVAPGPTYTPH